MSADRIQPTGALRQKQPRQENKRHTHLVGFLPCLICFREPPNGGRNDPMHIRYDDEARGKRAVGGAERPDDKWTVPGCRPHHDAQHSMNERQFWSDLGIDPLAVAEQLWKHTGDLRKMRSIVFRRGK